MDLFEQAKLKGQRLNLSTLLTKPEFKQQYFAPIRRLEESEQCCLLTKVGIYPLSIPPIQWFLCIQVINGECSLADLKVEAADLKQMRALKTAFLHLTNTDT